MLAELDEVIERGLKAGRSVKLPNGTTFRPVGKRDGRIDVKLRLNPRVVRAVNQEFRGKWINGANIGKGEAALIALWNERYPDNPVTQDTGFAAASGGSNGAVEP